ncbi:protein SDA1 homolog [Selaginella moellendorffii]|uniref:protein SDA1 homolog n=1 Tax=Selaginella moellendorffii TaxID=88036 RepID=UPI000D1CFBFD|nr:protein SDA1 homolog [Selaginella moellendorffii]|eukprot:XP_024541552.1 protein SDA1 homolog [Selaginella moellendorffii]
MEVTPHADLLLLQSRMKEDPGGYEAELDLQLRHFKACLGVLELEAPDAGNGNVSFAALAPDHAAAKELGDMAMFLAHVTPSYPKQLAGFPHQLLNLLKNASNRLPSSLRCHLAQALILLRNREKISLVEVLPVMIKLQSSGDKNLKKFVSSHLLQNISRMNRKHRNEAKNRSLQNIIFPVIQEDDEARAKHAFVLTCELYRRKVWIDPQTANAICNACFHKSPRIMIATLKFLHGYENKYDEDSDESDQEDDTPSGAVGVSKEAIYKSQHKGTVSSKKKKQAKIERAIRSLKKQQRIKAQEEKKGSFAPLEHLRDPQEFAEKLFARLQNCNEKFQVKLMMIMVISRCVGMHQLLLLSFYPHLQRYVSPHQQDETQLLAAAVQACHDKVPVDAVEPLLKQLVNSFVHDRSRPEVIAVGLNTVREICARMPLIMTRDLLEDLSMYKKSREKAVSAAANSIIGLYRQVNPSLLMKKHRGRGTDLSVEPKAFGKVIVHTDVPGVELLAEQEEDEDNSGECGDEDDESGREEEEESSEEEGEGSGEELEDDNDEEDEEDDEGEDDEDSGDDNEGSDEDVPETLEKKLKNGEMKQVATLKRKKMDGEESNLDDMSLSQLKRFAGSKLEDDEVSGDGILSNEDFRRIREIQAKREAENALSNHGLRKIASESQNQRPLDPSKLEANIRRKQSKEERIASSKAGRDDRGTYTSRAAVKKRKTGGLSNRQKEKKKNLPVAARRMKSARTREHRKSKARLTKNFRGKKAWK